VVSMGRMPGRIGLLPYSGSWQGADWAWHCYRVRWRTDHCGASAYGRWPDPFEEQVMSVGTILLIVLVLLLVGAIPTWPHSRSWGYAPGGLIGVLLIVLLIMLLTGRI
jgi:hypothetical protein